MPHKIGHEIIGEDVYKALLIGVASQIAQWPYTHCNTRQQTLPAWSRDASLIDWRARFDGSVRPW
jgi:hypothetical protein